MDRSVFRLWYLTKSTSILLFPVFSLLLILTVQNANPQGDVSMGKDVYRRYCIGCHGEKGDGNGVAAKDLLVKPRDFREGIFEFKSTPKGSLPTDEDLLRVITQGLPLSSMPSFKLLPEVEKRAVIAYIKTFSDKWKDGVPGESLANVKIPEFVGTPESVKRGEGIYRIRCVVCHGVKGMGDGPAARALKDAWGNPIKPANFTYGFIDRGPRVEDIYISITLGVDGTPMPAFERVLSDEERWDLTSYILKLMGSLE